MDSANRHAIFLSPDATYHADRCEPLVQAVARGEVELVAWVHRGYPGTPMPPRLLPEISTVGYWNATGLPDWGLDWHRNEGIELTYVSRGRTAFLVEGEAYTLESGQLTVTRPWQKHKVGNPQIGSTRLHWLILDVGVRRPDQRWQWPDWLVLSPTDLRRLTTLLSHNEQPVWHANQDVALCFERMASLVRTPSPAAGQSRLRLLINELFIALLDLLSRRNPPLNPHLVTTRRSVEMFLRALDDHLGHPWTLGEMAERCGLGRSRFADYCREITNMTPTDFLARRRVEAAKRLLRSEPRLPITDVALQCGFQSSQYFATVFRKSVGETPREYRQAGSVSRPSQRTTLGPVTKPREQARGGARLQPSLVPSTSHTARQQPRPTDNPEFIESRPVRAELLVGHEPQPRAGIPACRVAGLSSPAKAGAIGKSPERADENVCPTNQRLTASRRPG